MNAMGGKNMEQEIKVGSRVRLVKDGFGARKGTTGTVKAIDTYGFIIQTDIPVESKRDYSFFGIPAHHGTWKPTAYVELLPDAPAAPSPAWSIHITPDGNTTHAVFKQGKHLTGHASAFCSPRDTYDATTGAAWAFLRLPGMSDTARRVLAEMGGAKEPKQEPKHGMTLEECKVGTKVRFIDADAHKGFPQYYPAVGTVGVVKYFDRVARDVIVQWPEGSTSHNDCWGVNPWWLEHADVAAEPAPVPQPMYKPGDRVRIVDKWGHFCGESPNGKMDKWLGKIMTVREKREDAFRNFLYKMEEDRADNGANDGWYWFPAAIVGKVGESRREK